MIRLSPNRSASWRQDRPRLRQSEPTTYAVNRLILGDDSLSYIPWEWVFPDPEDGAPPLVRYAENRFPREPSLLARPPRFVFVSSSPRAKDAVGGEGELSHLTSTELQAVLSSIRLESVVSASARTLEEALSKQSCEVLHFVGHGYVDDAGSGYLAFQFEDEGSQWRPYSDFISVERLGGWVRRGGVRVVGLQTPSIGNYEVAAFARIATRITDIGADAILFSLLDDRQNEHAEAFGRFYRSLFSGIPVAEAYRYAVQPFEKPPLGLYLYTPEPYVIMPSVVPRKPHAGVFMEQSPPQPRIGAPYTRYHEYLHSILSKGSAKGDEESQRRMTKQMEASFREADLQLYSPRLDEVVSEVLEQAAGDEAPSLRDLPREAFVDRMKLSRPEVEAMQGHVDYQRNRLNDLSRMLTRYGTQLPKWLQNQLEKEKETLGQLVAELRSAVSETGG